MQVKDWSVFGQLGAWLTIMMDRCKKFVAEKQVSPEIMGWLLDHPTGQKVLTEALEGIVRRRQIFERTRKNILKPFAQIRVEGVPPSKLLVQINALGNNIEGYVHTVVTKSSSVAIKKIGQVNLTCASLEELGFIQCPRGSEFLSDEFCAEWSKNNLDGYVIELCEIEDALQLRIQYQDQPLGEHLYAAMRLLNSSIGGHLLDIRGGECDNPKPISAPKVSYNDPWSLESVFFFRLRKL